MPSLSPTTHPFLYHSTGKAMWRLVSTTMSHWASLRQYQWVNRWPGATAWWYAVRKMANPGGQWISRHSTSMPREKPITHRAHFIRPILYLVALRRLSLTVRTATTVFPFTLTTATSPPSLPHGGNTDTKQHPRGTLHQVMATPEDYDEIVSHIPNKTKCTDDTLLWAHNFTKSFFQAVEWLDICGHNGIIFNPNKFVFGAGTVEFAGFEITSTNIQQCKKYLDAICNFPTPTNITEVRSWFGLINQVSYAFAATCYPSASHSNPAHPSNGTMNLMNYLTSRNQWSLRKLKREYGSLTNPNQLA